jgi:hypothetical protein
MQELEPREDTVDGLLEAVNGLLRAEEARATGLDTRGSGLAGFLALIASVTLALGQRGLAAPLPALWKTVTIVLFLATLLLLFLTVGVTVLKVLFPQSYRSIATAEVRTYATSEVVSKPKVMAQGSVMRGLIEALATERKRNDGKARWLRRSYGALVVGVALATANGAILGLHAGGVL